MPLSCLKYNLTFNISPEDILNDTSTLIDVCRRFYDKVIKVPDTDVSIDTVLKSLSEADHVCKRKRSILSLYQNVSTSEGIRVASTIAEKKLLEFIVETKMRKDLHAKMLVLQQKGDLKPGFKTQIDKLVLQGKNSGLDLEDAAQQKIKEINSKINNLVVDFMKNLNDVTTSLQFSEKELSGLPADFLQSLKKNPDEKYEVSLNYSQYIVIMENCRVEETRRQLEFAFNSQCFEENGLILTELRTLRHKAAVIKGFSCHSSYINRKSNMVYMLLEEFVQKLIPVWEEEKKRLLELKQEECAEMGTPFDGQLNSWDLDYLLRRSKELKFGFNKLKLRDYFPFPVVKKGLLTIYQDLLGFQFEQVDGEKWHEDVEMYSVSDSSNGTLLAYFFFDLFPRPNKYGHQAAFKLQESYKKSDSSHQPCVYAMVENLTKPEKDKPALLDLFEVLTFLYDFAHVMRNICKDIEYPFFRLKSILFDAPSQMSENWSWEKDPLLKISSHYVDNSPIPQDVLEALLKSRVASIGYSTFRHICLALYDQTIYSSPEGDTVEIYNYIVKKYIGIEPQPGTHFPCLFNHLVETYDARYYVLLLPKVYSMHMLQTGFENVNCFNYDVGKDYMKKILGSKDIYEIGEHLWDLTKMFLDSLRSFTSKAVSSTISGVKSLYSFSNVCWIVFTSSAVLLASVIFQVENTQLEVQCQQQQQDGLDLMYNV